MNDASPAGRLDPAPPDPARWDALSDDLFDRVVAHVRRALTSLEDDHLDVEVRRLRSVPLAKLRRGRGRRRLVAALSKGGPFWVALRTRIEADEELAGRLVAALDGPTGDDDRAADGEDDDAGEAMARLQDRVRSLAASRDELRTQRDEARADRDAARRALEGAQGREGSLRADLQGARADLADRDARIEALQRRLDGVDDTVAGEVARERRRRAGEVAALQARLADARRELDELRREAAHQRRREATAGRAGQQPGRSDRTSPAAPARGDERDDDAVRHGRPTRLPRGLRLDTREGADLLMAPGRRVLVDGYNVTRTHQPGLDLAGQRRWLLDKLAGLAASRGVEPTAVFDAHEGGQRGAGRRRRGVRVQYTHPGNTADDELVFAVEAAPPDEPLVVVTDDRELRGRLAPYRVDLLHTNPFVWLLP